MDPTWLQKAVLIAMHRRVLAEHGGSEGVRDENLLESALARPQHLLAYGNPDIFELAAAYTFGIAKNHPFIDGNKRSAFMAAYVFLARNGWLFQAPEADVVITMNALASSERTEAELALWLRSSCKAIH
jgi:death on curing protein